MEKPAVINIKVNHVAKGVEDITLKAEDFCLGDLLVTCVHLIKTIAEESGRTELSVMNDIARYFINERIDISNKESH